MRKTLLLVGAFSLINCQDKAQNLSASSVQSNNIPAEVDSTKKYEDQDSLDITTPKSIAVLKTSDTAIEKQEIQSLIRQVLKWANSESKIDLLPVFADRNDHAYVGVNINQHMQNLSKLKSTTFFATEFIENYNRIILILDERLKKGGKNEWLVGDMAPFSFASEADPWCNCQDVPYDNPNPWNEVRVEIVALQNDKGELVWRWGIGEQESEKYRFNVVKENGKWKIAYMEGFDFTTSTKQW